MLQLLIAVGIVACALQAILVKRLLISAVWLAGASALAALLIYTLDAPEIAVVELSVGAGLVTVLFVFAINIAGEENPPFQTRPPRVLSILTIVLVSALLAALAAPLLNLNLPVLAESHFASVFWENRSLDVLLQVVLIFAGVMAVLGLLAEKPSHS